MLEHEEWPDREECWQKRLPHFTNLIRVSRYRIAKARQDITHLTNIEIKYVCITENRETHECD